MDQSALCADEESEAGAKPAPGLQLPLRDEVADWGQVGQGGRPQKHPVGVLGIFMYIAWLGRGPHWWLRGRLGRGDCSLGKLKGISQEACEGRP